MILKSSLEKFELFWTVKNTYNINVKNREHFIIGLFLSPYFICYLYRSRDKNIIFINNNY